MSKGFFETRGIKRREYRSAPVYKPKVRTPPRHIEVKKPKLCRVMPFIVVDNLDRFLQLNQYIRQRKSVTVFQRAERVRALILKN